VRGRCLEIKEPAYTKWFGGKKVTASDVLDIDRGNPEATLHGDLSLGADIPDAQYDCFVLTQTLHLVYDFKGALFHALRVLRPSGTLLVTVPAVARVLPGDAGIDTDYWRFTEASMRRLFAELPKAVRQQLGDLPAVVARLEQDAQAMRQRIEELNGSLSDLAAGAAGPGLTAQRNQLAESLARTRDAAQARLQDAVTSLETIRLGLLRMHAGTGAVEGVTQDLSKAGEIAADIERLLEGQEEVERVLRTQPQP